VATFAIGDIHGNLAALDDLLTQILAELSAADTVVFLGDYIDRGSDSKGCIERILRFQKETPATVITLIGNHEDWLLRTLRDYTKHSWLLGMEAFATIESYSPDAAVVLRQAAERAGPKLITDTVRLPYESFAEAIPEEHLAFLNRLQLYHHTDHALFVHGGIEPGRGSIGDQPRDTVIWGTDRFVSEYSGPDVVVYGHWNNAQLGADGWPMPAIQGASIGLDTIAHGVLTAIRLPDRRLFQSARFSPT
jgi:serine/threonine protein phosphatase 1